MRKKISIADVRLGSKYTSDCIAYAENSDLLAVDLFTSEAFVRRFSVKKRKHLRRSLFQIKLRNTACNIIIKETAAQLFHCEFSKNFKKAFFADHVQATASVKFQHSYTFFNSLWQLETAVQISKQLCAKTLRKVMQWMFLQNFQICSTEPAIFRSQNTRQKQLPEFFL